MRETESKIEQLRSINKTKVEAQLNYSINLINNIDKFMEAAPVEVKIKLIGSIFSEKIEFDGKNYRTNSYNQVLDLIYQQTKELQGCKKKKLDASCEVSNSVPLNILTSNQFLADLEKLWELRHYIPDPTKIEFNTPFSLE